MNGAGAPGALDDDLGESVEEGAFGLFIAFEAVGVAVADADEFGGSGDGEGDFVVGDGDDAAFFVEGFYLRIAMSSPSAWISVRSAVRRRVVAGPVVSRFSVRTTEPPR